MSIVNKYFTFNPIQEQYNDNLNKLKSQLSDIVNKKISMMGEVNTAIETGKPIPHLDTDKTLVDEFKLQNLYDILNSYYRTIIRAASNFVSTPFNFIVNDEFTDMRRHIENLDLALDKIINNYVNKLLKPLYKHNNLKERTKALKHLVNVNNIVNKLVKMLDDINIQLLEYLNNPNFIENLAEKAERSEDVMKRTLELNINKNNFYKNLLIKKEDKINELINPLRSVISDGTTLPDEGVLELKEYLNKILAPVVKLEDMAEIDIDDDGPLGELDDPFEDVDEPLVEPDDEPDDEPEGQGKHKKKQKTKKNKQGKGIIDYLKSKLKGELGSPKYNKNLKLYGNETITKLIVSRRPLDKMSSTLMNIISLGQFKKAMKNTGYDSMFHLALIINDKYNLEKSQNVIFDTKGRNILKPNSETMDVPLNNKTFTIQEAINNTIKLMGEDKYYNYDGFYNNCQDYLLNFLKGNGYGNKDVFEFVKQDMTEIIKETPSLSKKLLDIITKVGGEVGKLFPDLLGEGKKKQTKKQEKIKKVMKEFKDKKLKTHNKVVKDPKQALAIALSEAQKIKK
jgi:ElaB/YqjD/DUF883 family membrane-anchored ribosome-binding protein